MSGLAPPRVSVIIACYNYGRFLPQAVGSVRAQTLPDWECLIVDDASTDGSRAVIERLAEDEARIRYRLHERNLGPASARNRAASEARGEWLAVLDADDWWEPRKLELQLAALERAPGAVLSYHGHRRVEADGRALEWRATPEPALLRELLVQNFIPHDSTLIRREAFRALGGYDETLANAQDWDLLLRLALEHGPERVVCVPDVLLTVRHHARNISWNHARVAACERRIIRRHLPRAVVKYRVSPAAVLGGYARRQARRALLLGRRSRAVAWACAYLALGPPRRWRWRQAFGLLREAEQG